MANNNTVVAWRGMGSNPGGDIYFHLNFSIPACSGQLSRSHANEIKHDHSPVVIVVFRPQIRLIIQGLVYYSRSIALSHMSNVGSWEEKQNGGIVLWQNS